MDKVPSDEYLKRAVDREPGDRDDSLRQVFCVFRMAMECDRADLELAADFYARGDRWPVPVRLAVLQHCPAALHLEQRLAAIAARPPRAQPPEEE